ncbi:MAG TPA: CBS domain-containing protein [Polyangiaceae bacterium]|nr:CBS domain-containing protein [Polyangiaceae bacterium]
MLTPKSEVVWLSAAGTLGEAIERMKPNGFAAVPILDDEGGYVGTLTEGDILWHLLDAVDPRLARDAPLLEVQRRTSYRPVHIDAKLDTLVLRAAEQNFVPVLDDREVFIGMVRRKSIIEQCLPSSTMRVKTGQGRRLGSPSAADGTGALDRVVELPQGRMPADGRGPPQGLL